MYAALWALLPGPTPVRILIAIVLVALVMVLLFTVIFPWASQFVPGQDVSVG
ncbi:hypothetical protein [Mycobacterium sp. M26]|uniref:hypothetical protein n=1 Tax=Mycobacterium sp. M26 TaxID=1762962 RepID=UPI000AB4C335|nr:hypothetical protein [Mycobacterium sp. M26]